MKKNQDSWTVSEFIVQNVIENTGGKKRRLLIGISEFLLGWHTAIVGNNQIGKSTKEIGFNPGVIGL